MEKTTVHLKKQLSFEVLVEGIKIGLAIGETNAFKKLGTKYWDKIPMPGENKGTVSR